MSGISGCRSGVLAIVVGLLLLGSVPGEAFLGDSSSHPPPTVGGYAYYSTYGSFGPDQPGFPGRGQSYVDPVFGSTIRRLTDEFPSASQSDIYSKNGYWNADGTLMAHHTPAGYTIIDTTTGETVRTGVPGNYDGSFAPDDPDVWYYFSGASLRKYSVSSGTTALVKTFAATLNTLGGSTDWVDASGRYMVFKIGNSGRVWDRATDTLYAGSIPFTSETGWMGISPDGKYVITAGEWKLTSFAINHAAKSVNTTGVLFWTSCGDHGDIVSASDGKTYLVAGECHEEAAIYAVDVTIPQTADDIPKQRADNRRLFYYNWSDDWHMSGVSRGAARDWMFLSIESYDDAFTGTVSAWRPYKQEILMVNVLTGELRRLAHHRSRGLEQSYYHQPRVSASWDGSRVAWASNFGYAGSDYSDIYAITVSGGTTSPPPPPPPPPPPTGDTTAPTVTITSPASSSTITTTKLTIAATASDDRGVASVAFYVNDRKVGADDTIAPYKRVWDTTGLPGGAYSIKAVASDAAGNRRSATISVTLKRGTSGGDGGGDTTDALWTDKRNVAVWGTDIRKSGGCDGCSDSGAGSTQAIASGDGYVQFRAVAGPLGYVGLTTGATTYTVGGLPFALGFQGSYMTVWESGRYRADVPFTTSDVFRIEIAGGVVRYKKNGTTFYRSSLAPTYPLRANVVFLDLAAVVRDTAIHAGSLVSGTTPTTERVTWTNTVNVTVTAGALRKSGGCDGCPDAGGRSVQRIGDGGGWLQFSVTSPAGLAYVGLTSGGGTTDGSAFAFALAFQQRYVTVYESGVYRADVQLDAGDVYRIAVSANGAVTYRRNGVAFYRSALRATSPLRVAAALYDVGATVTRAVVRNNS